MMLSAVAEWTLILRHGYPLPWLRTDGTATISRRRLIIASATDLFQRKNRWLVRFLWKFAKWACRSKTFADLSENGGAQGAGHDAQIKEMQDKRRPVCVGRTSKGRTKMKGWLRMYIWATLGKKACVKIMGIMEFTNEDHRPVFYGS